MVKELKDNAIVIKSVDIGESDKLLTLFSLESGKFQAKIRGVKKPRAKLAFASLPFCFGEYLLAKNKNSFTVINCNAIDNFFQITSDLNKFYAGSTILEIVNILSRANEKNVELFVLTLKALKSLAYSENGVLFVLAKYLLEVVGIAGYKIDTKQVDNKSGRKVFDFESGSVVIGGDGENSIKLSKDMLLCFERLIKIDFSENTDLDIKGIKNVLRLLIIYFEDKTGEILECVKIFLTGK